MNKPMTHIINKEEQHIVKMWTPLHFSTPDNYIFFPDGPVFVLFNLFFRGIVYIVGPLIFKLFLGLKVVNRDKLQKLPSKGITVCNHVHMLDCAIVACHMNHRKICIPTLESNFCIPFLRHIIRILGGIPLPEKVKPFRKMYDALVNYVNKGHLVHIYPEAVLNPGYNGIRPFKRGAFLLAYDCNVPIIPYVIRYVKPEGIWKLIGKKRVMRLYILDPVYPDISKSKKAETMRLCQEVQRRMEDVFKNDTF